MEMTREVIQSPLFNERQGIDPDREKLLATPSKKTMEQFFQYDIFISRNSRTRTSFNLTRITRMIA